MDRQREKSANRGDSRSDNSGQSDSGYSNQQNSAATNAYSQINNSNTVCCKEVGNKSGRTIDVNFKLNGTSVKTQMPENQENILQKLLKELLDSKAISGY